MNPIIIAHNCGYIGYETNPYSLESTMAAYRDCDYLEIDLVLRKIEGEMKWWYYHDGIQGEGSREKGISLDQFLEEFMDVSDEVKPKTVKPGLFLDLKEHLKHTKVNNLMNTLNKKYENKEIPTGTSLMIYTGRGIIPHFHSVYRHTTRYFIKWLFESGESSCILDPKYCPKLTIVTREIEIKKLVEGKGLIDPIRHSALNDIERSWFWENFKKRIWWGFNPHPIWFFKYKFDKIFEDRITIIPWYVDKTPIKLWGEKKEGWINVIVTILFNYWLYKSRCIENSSEVEQASWGLITYAPNKLKECLEQWSFNDIR